MKRAGLLLRTAVAITLVLPAIPALAQDETPSRESEADSGDIVVTAQRRSERLQDVPMSITALSADMLEQAGVTTTADLARVTPGVTMTFYGGFLQPAIRGITSTGANIGENSNVAMYIDGVYQPQQIATLIDLPDVQQIEVLKGPQGALYGQNATGGAILVTSKAPSFTPEGKFSASYGNYNDVQLRGYVTGPLMTGIAASLSGAFQDRDGFRRHVITRERDKGLNSKVVRGKVLLEPSDAMRLTLTGFYSNRRDSATYAGFAIDGNSIGYAGNLAGLGIPGIPVPPAPRATSAKQFEADPDVFTRIKTHGGSLRAELDVAGGTITSVSGIVRNKIGYLADIDATAPRIAEARAEPLIGRYFVHDTNFASGGDGPFSFLVGAFYLKGREAFGGNIFEGFFPVLPPAPRVSLFRTDSFAQVKKEIIAGYAEVTFKPTEKLTLTAGGRYTRERQRTSSNVQNGIPAGSIIEYPRDPVTFKKFTPRVTARYEMADDLNVYASWGRGFKSGVVNPTDFTLDPVRPETIDAWEVGLKGRLMDNLRVNVAAFYYNYKNLQAVAYVPPNYITQNAATARVKGIDFDFALELTPEFSLSGGAALLDAKYKDFPNAAVFQPFGTGSLQIVADLSGGRLLRSPKFSGNIAANYSADVGPGKLSAFASLYYNSGFGLELSNRIRQSKFATVDAELALEPNGLPGTKFALWGKNLTDKAVYATVLSSQLSDAGAYAPPRTFGVRAEYEF